MSAYWFPVDLLRGGLLGDGAEVAITHAEGNHVGDAQDHHPGDVGAAQSVGDGVTTDADGEQEGQRAPNRKVKCNFAIFSN